MEFTVKYRDASVCNCKLMLIYFVVLSHLIRPCIYGSEVAYGIYHFIFSFHMPAFAFLSGIYMKNAASCLKNAKTSIIRYLVAQIMFALIFRGDINLILPYWHLWYLLALSFWCLFGAGFNRLSRPYAVTVLIVSFVLGCTAGFVSGIDRNLSLSRVIVFLPYFLIGIMMPKNIKEHTRRKYGSVFLISGVVLYLIFKNKIPVFFMCQAEPFGKLGFNGVMLRLICYAIGILITLGIYYISPNKHLAISKIGTDTLMIYILHGPIVEWIRGYSDNGLYIALSFIISAIIIYLLHRIFAFSGNIYTIRERKGERIRDGTVL